MRNLILVLMWGISHMAYAQSSKVTIETEAPNGEERNQLDIRNSGDGSLSASILRMFTGTGPNMVESGFRNLPYSYDAVVGYGGYLTLSNNASGLIFRADQTNSDMRFLLGGFPIQENQKMILTSNGNLGVGAHSPDARIQVKGGDIYLEDSVNGVIMKSPNGKCWRLTVTDDGAPSFVELDCPGTTPLKNDQ